MLTSRRDFLKRCCQGTAFMGLGTQVPILGAETAVREFRRGGMLYRRLGKTDLFVSVLGFGAHVSTQYRLSDSKGIRLSEEGQAQRDRQIAHALELGVNLVDVYNDVGQWDPMARLLKGKRDRVLVSQRLQELHGPVVDFIDSAARLFGHVDLCRYPTDEFGQKTLEDWDALRKAKAAGKIRAIGMATHEPEAMRAALTELEGLDFIMFPYNFIHARVAYADFLPAAIKKGVGLIAIKPLGCGSIVRLDPHRPRPEARREYDVLTLYGRETTPMLEEAVAKLRDELDRLPGETLAQAALRYVFSKPFIASAIPGMWLDEEVEENYHALMNCAEMGHARLSVLESAREVADLAGSAWLPSRYRWLDEKWKNPQSSRG